jgi:hypothetical protein
MPSGIDAMTPLMSPSMTSLVSSRAEPAGGPPLRQRTDPADRSGRGVLPGPQTVGSSSSHVFSRARGSGGRLGGNGAVQKLSKTDKHERKPLVLAPEDLQGKMMQFQTTMAVTQAGGQMLQSGQQFDQAAGASFQPASEVEAPPA